MTKRLTRFECSALDNKGSVIFSFKWTRGVYLIKEVFDIFTKSAKMPTISFQEFFECVVDCKENSNVLMDDEFGNTLQIRRWSYHKLAK